MFEIYRVSRKKKYLGAHTNTNGINIRTGVLFTVYPVCYQKYLPPSNVKEILSSSDVFFFLILLFFFFKKVLIPIIRLYILRFFFFLLDWSSEYESLEKGLFLCCLHKQYIRFFWWTL